MTVACAVAGGIIVDNVVMPDGTVHRRLVGGNAVHAAIGARLWCEEVGVIGVVPRNYPTEALDRLAGALDLAGIHRVDEDVARSEWFFYDDEGRRIDRLHASDDAFARAGFATDRLSPAEAERWRQALEAQPSAGDDYGSFRRRHPVAPRHLPRAYADVPAMHLAPGLPAAQLELLRALRARAQRITLDPGFHAASMDGATVAALLATVDAFLPSEVELAALVPGAQAADAVRGLRARIEGVVVGKLGARGSLVADARDRAPRAVPAIEVVARDPTGAGDAFCGGFLAGLTRGCDPLLAACLATVSASFAVESVGALAALDADRTRAKQRLDALVASLGLAPSPDMTPSRSPS